MSGSIAEAARGTEKGDGGVLRVTVPGESAGIMVSVLGEHDAYLKIVQRSFPDVKIVVRGNEIMAQGGEAALARQVFEELIALAGQGRRLDSAEVRRTVDMVREDVSPSEISSGLTIRPQRGRVVRPKTAGQRKYVEAIESNIITFAIGPAGTGKSYLAVAMAVQALSGGEVERIILTRPAVEAGERLGFLPGDLMAKVDPYLRPLYDALYDMLTPDGAQRMLERGTIEVAPLAFMRGRTLNQSFVILDEAQNTTPEQMKMFLTRIGFGSKAVVTGDVTQIDVGGGQSGLVGLDAILDGVEGLSFVYLTRKDVVRHYIVAQIVAAYERNSRS